MGTKRDFRLFSLVSFLFENKHQNRPRNARNVRFLIVDGMLWMDKAVGPDSDHLSPWAQGATSMTKYRCRNCHAAKTTYEKVRSADKRSGIQRSPTAPIEQKDASTTYDVDFSGCNRRGHTKLSFASGGVA